MGVLLYLSSGTEIEVEADYAEVRRQMAANAPYAPPYNERKTVLHAEHTEQIGRHKGNEISVRYSDIIACEETGRA